jgi:hypothetical protein
VRSRQCAESSMTICDLRRLKLGAYNMPNKTTRFLITILPVLLSFSMAEAQQSTTPAPPNPCTIVEQKQLEFWVGDWDLTWPGPKAGETLHGANHIQRILDGCVVQENFSNEATNYRGTSISIFDAPAGKWKQTWVDNGGAYLDFVGEFKNGQMILQREAVGKNGAKSLQRMVWKNITANEFDWSWEASQDDGKTWQVQWPIHYKRKS